MPPIVGARRLVDFIESLPDLQIQRYQHESYGHMGATLADAGLQAGLNYRTVVAPRVNHLKATWPGAKTTSGFLYEISRGDLGNMIAWSHHDKIQRIYDMASLFAMHSVENEAELHQWLNRSGNRTVLRGIRGIGPKTVDYLWKLAGGRAIAIDRHLKRFAIWAGLSIGKYDEIEKTYRYAADILSVDCSSLDRAIWYYVSEATKS